MDLLIRSNIVKVERRVQVVVRDVSEELLSTISTLSPFLSYSGNVLDQKENVKKRLLILRFPIS